MALKDYDNLVICSTLNQVTNYLIIKKVQPKNVYNITLSEDARKSGNKNMKNDKWDDYLSKELKLHESTKNINFKSIKLQKSEIHHLNKLKGRLKDDIIEKFKHQNEPILWNITGGQRITSLAISEAIKERENDKLLYIEGNSEEIVILNNKKESDTEEDILYSDSNLTMEEALRLTGFDIRDGIDSTLRVYKDKGEFKVKNKSQDKFDKEHNFYINLYNKMTCKNDDDESDKLNLNRENTELTVDGYKYKINSKEIDCKGNFRDLLIASNKIVNPKRVKDGEEIQDTNRVKYVLALFQKYYDLDKQEYNFKESSELNQWYPAGHIFEKIVFHRIYDVIENECKVRVNEIMTNLKTNFYHDELEKGEDTIIDELDIAILTDTGKLINLECKSGRMSGDNAKSTKYTTYRLSGVFGMPILISPLYDGEDSEEDLAKKNKILSDSVKAFRAASRAELEKLTLDKFEDIRDYI